MKKTLSFSLIFAFAVIGTAHAQLSGYGIKAATTYPNYEWRTHYPGQISPELSSLQGYNVAIYAQWFDLPYLSIITQLEYAERGNSSTYTFEDPLHPRTQNNRVSYLSLPVFAKLTPINTPVRPFLLAGPRIDYLAGKEIEDVGLGLYDHLKTWVLGYTMGVGLESNKLFGVNITLEARYNGDITNSFHGSGIEIFNKAFDFWLGIGI